MKKSWRKYCKMLKKSMNELIYNAIDENQITRESVYNMHILTNTLKDIYKIDKMISEQERHSDEILNVMYEMECAYKELKESKEKHHEKIHKDEIIKLMNLYDKLMDEFKVMELSEEEIKFVKTNTI